MPPDAVARANPDPARRRDRTMLLAAAAAALTACWWLLWRHDAVPAHGVFAPHPVAVTRAAYPAVFGMWLVMSVAMMLPPALPWLRLMIGTAGVPTLASRPQDAKRVKPLRDAAMFAVGYFLVWSAYSALAAGVQLGAQGVVAVDLATAGLGGAAGGTVLVVAGLVQLTPLKAACLAKCRSPIALFLTHWRPGARPALSLGLRHGLHCLGCCWALMGVAFAVGVMNLLWMAGLTAAIVAEQMGPRGELLARVFGVGLVLWGVGVMV